MIDKDRVDTELRCQFGYELFRLPMQDSQPAADILQFRIEFNDRLADELDAPVMPLRQGVEDAGIEDEGAIHPPARLERAVQCRVVVYAQVAPEPEKRGVVVHSIP